jgi:hypothetical protein
LTEANFGLGKHRVSSRNGFDARLSRSAGRQKGDASSFSDAPFACASASPERYAGISRQQPSGGLQDSSGRVGKRVIEGVEARKILIAAPNSTAIVRKAGGT